MAYIEWWNRTGPVTMGERFGLNEISIARNTLSPTKSYVDGGRIALGDGSITYTGKGEHKGKYHLRLGGGKSRTTHRGTKTELEKILKKWKITNPPGVNRGKQIIKGDPILLQNILDDIPKMSNKAVQTKYNITGATLWEIMQDHPKLEFGAKEPKAFSSEVTERLNKLQKIIKDAKIPEGQIKASDDIIKTLAKKMGVSSEEFLGNLAQLKEEYGRSTGRIEINKNVKKILGRFPDPKFISEHLRAVGYSEKTIKTLNAVEGAAKVVANSKTNLEHSLPRNLIKFFKLPRKYLLMGERTSNFLNQFKKQFDNKLLLAAKDHAKGNLTYNEYKKAVDAIRDTVRKATGGYEIGYVDFKDGKPVAITSQKSILKGTDVVGKKTTGLINFFKNAQYHNALYNNWMKDKNNKIFTTLNEEIGKMKKHKIKFLPEKELEETYNAIKNFKNKEQFMEFYKKYPTSPFFKSLSKVASMAGGKGKLIIGGAATFSLLSSALAAEELEPSDKKQEASVLPSVISEHPILSSAAAVTAAAPKKVWEGVKWAGKKLTPIMTPAGSHVLHGGKYDLTSGQDLSTAAFWKHATDWMGARSRWGNKMIGLKKRLKDIALRGGLPTRFLPLISGTASVAAGPMLIKDAAEWLQSRIDKEGLTGKIEEQSGIIGDEAGASLLMEDVRKKQKESVEGMDYAQGGIASLIK